MENKQFTTEQGETIIETPLHNEIDDVTEEIKQKKTKAKYKKGRSVKKNSTSKHPTKTQRIVKAVSTGDVELLEKTACPKPFITSSLQPLEDDDTKRAAIGKVMSNLLYFYNQGGKGMPKTDEELENRIASFFVACADTHQNPTVEKMCLAIGITNNTFNMLREGRQKIGSRTAVVAQKALQFLSSYDSEMVLDNRINPVTYIFRSKNYYGMQDKVEHQITSGELTERTTEEIAAEYDGIYKIKEGE